MHIKCIYFSVARFCSPAFSSRRSSLLAVEILRFTLLLVAPRLVLLLQAAALGKLFGRRLHASAQKMFIIFGQIVSRKRRLAARPWLLHSATSCFSSYTTRPTISASQSQNAHSNESNSTRSTSNRGTMSTRSTTIMHHRPSHRQKNRPSNRRQNLIGSTQSSKVAATPRSRRCQA